MVAESDIAAVNGMLRRVFARRVADPHQLDDVVQETLARVLKADPQLSGDELVAYAIVTARNTLIEWQRRDREVPGDVDDDIVSWFDPEGAALVQEERSAVREALASQPEHDRSALVAHEVEGRTAGDIAAATQSTAAAVAARLARARARARVDYVVALRNVRLPTARCHDVLVSLSSGLKRRQREVGAAEHLLECSTCADLAPPVVDRRRTMAAFIPIAGLASLIGRARRAIAQRPVATGGAAAGAAVAVVLLVVGLGTLFDHGEGRADGGDTETTSQVAADRRRTTTVPPTTAPSTTTATTTATTAGSTTVPAPPATNPPAVPTPAPAGVTCEVVDSVGGVLSDLAPAALAPLVGSIVTVEGGTVSAVPAPAGVWLDCNGRVWLQLGPLGAVSLAPGQRITIAGVVTPHGPGYAVTQGVATEPDAAELDASGLHLQAVGPPSLVG
jgi:RNA polymerase sigma factor (sigma-70 family)